MSTADTFAEPTIYLHIGAPKTGSTALQYFLMSNRDILAENNVLYPILGEAEPIQHHVFIRPYCDPHPNDGIWSAGPQNRLKTERELRLALDQEIVEKKANKVLISSEVFFAHQAFFADYINKESLAASANKLLTGYDVKIIVYLRRQDHWLESCYGETIKGAHSASHLPIQEYLLYRDKKLLDYEYLLQPWSEAFGAENVIVRRYTKENLPNGIVPDFLETIGLDPGLFGKSALKNARENTSIDRDSLEFLRFLNRINHELLEGERLTIPFRPEIIAKSGLSKKFNFLTLAERKSLLESVHESNNRISDLFIGDHKPLFSDNSIRDPAEEPYPGLSQEALTLIFLQMVADIWSLVNRLNANKADMHDYKSLIALTDEMRARIELIGKLFDEVNELKSCKAGVSDIELLLERTKEIHNKIERVSAENSMLSEQLALLSNDVHELRLPWIKRLRAMFVRKNI